MSNGSTYSYCKGIQIIKHFVLTFFTLIRLFTYGSVATSASEPDKIIAPNVSRSKSTEQVFTLPNVSYR